MIDATQIFDGALAPGANPGVTGTAVTTSRVSTNVIDMLAFRDVGQGTPLGLHVIVTQAFTGGTSLQIDYEVGATAGGTYYPLLLSPTYPTAQLIIGAPVFRYALPMNQLLNSAAGVLNAPGRFCRLNYTVVGTYTAGAVFAYLNPVMDRQQFVAYPNNYSV